MTKGPESPSPDQFELQLDESGGLAWDPSGEYLKAASDPAVIAALRAADEEARSLKEAGLIRDPGTMTGAHERPETPETPTADAEG
jgi:hypothetical protein